MLTSFQWISAICILLVAVAGGWYPLFRRDLAGTVKGFPLGQAFAAGVFLALSLTIMLPNGFHLFGKAFPGINYPVASALGIAAYVLLLALGISLGSDPETLAPLLGALCGGGVLLLMAGLEARRAGWGSPSIWLVPGLLALNRSFAGWSTGGLETQFFSLLLLGGYASLICERRRLAPRPWLSSLLLALAAITRADGGLFLIPAGLCFAVDVLLRRRSFGSLAVWTLPVVLIVGLHLLWRHSYYGFWLPNTFYAKVGGFWYKASLIWPLKGP